MCQCNVCGNLSFYFQNNIIWCITEMAKLMCLGRFGNGVCEYMHVCEYNNVCSCNYTGEWRIRSRYTIQSLSYTYLYYSTHDVCAEASW